MFRSALAICGATAFFIYLTATIAAQTITLVSGNLNGVAVEAGVLEIAIAPEDSVKGSITVEAINPSPQSNVAPLVMVWSWGAHETSFTTIYYSLPTGTSSYEVPVELASPGLDGIYYLSFAFSLEMTGAQVASLTNWQTDGGKAHWNDGHDIADWSESEYQQSVVSHFVTTLYEGPGGLGNSDLGAAMVKIEVVAPEMKINSTSPAQNALNVDVSSPISVGFSHMMDPTSINNSTMAVTSRLQGHIPGDVVYSSSTGEAVFDHMADFLRGDLIHVLITRGVHSLTGDSLEHAYNWSFTTASEPGPTTFTFSASHPISATPYSVIAADLNNDGEIDLATAGRDGGISVLYMGSGGLFEFDSTYATGSHPERLIAADFNNDGLLDLASQDNSSILVRLCSGGGSYFGAAVSLNAGSLPTDLCAADLDGDGDADLAVSSYGNNWVAVLFNNGDGSFSGATTYPAGTMATGICAGDLDNDGDIDLISGTWFDSKIYLMFNDGHGVFSGTVSHSVAGWPRRVRTVELNGDGYLDIVVGAETGSCGILLNSGDGTFVLDSLYGPGSSVLSVTCVDLDGDADQDIIASCLSADSLYALMNDGSGHFELMPLLQTGTGHSDAAAADFDDDGDIDIAMTDLYGSQVHILVNDFSSDVAELPISELPTSFNLSRNYPNPFNPSTKMEFTLPYRTQVRLTIINILGQEIKRLAEGTLDAGNYAVDWDGTDAGNHSVAAGVYLCRLEAGKFAKSVKLVLVK